MAKKSIFVPRYIEDVAAEDLESKMVFVAGPRQVGKTTLAKRILEEREGVYLLWDNTDDRKDIRKARWPGGEALVVLDELHKWRTWKRWLKGEYDKHGHRLKFLVTGSARLDVYRRGGDSLQGRYHRYRLHPMSVAEVEGRLVRIEPGNEIEVGKGAREALDGLLERSGFPEPLLSHSARSLRRWHNERLERFFREEVRDLENVRDLSVLEVLSDLLVERVTSPLSINSVREDLEVSHRAVTHWIDIFERLYHVFRIRPFARRTIRSLKKRSKVYMWDSGLVPERGARFENVVALHLLKFCHWMEDAHGWRTRLHYMRDTSGREVDFLVACDAKPWFAVEAKLSEKRPDRSLLYFKDRLHIPWAYQVVLDCQRDFIQDGVRVVPADRFLASLV